MDNWSIPFIFLWSLEAITLYFSIFHCIIMFLNFFLTSSSKIMMRVYFQWFLYKCSLSMNLYLISHQKVLLFSKIYDYWCAIAPLLRVYFFRFLWHNFVFSRKSVICLLCRTIISVWNCCKREIFLFNFLSAATAYFSPEQALCYLLSGYFVIHLFWWFISEVTDEIHPFIFWSLPCIS